MSCNCLKIVEQKTLEHLEKKYPDRTYAPVNHFGSTGFENVTYKLQENGGTFIYFLFKAKYTFIKTNGQLSAPKTEKTNIHPTFCPFCGVKLVEDK